jgi:hypothetical protein
MPRPAWPRSLKLSATIEKAHRELLAARNQFGAPQRQKSRSILGSNWLLASNFPARAIRGEEKVLPIQPAFETLKLQGHRASLLSTHILSVARTKRPPRRAGPLFSFQGDTGPLKMRALCGRTKVTAAPRVRRDKGEGRTSCRVIGFALLGPTSVAVAFSIPKRIFRKFSKTERKSDDCASLFSYGTQYIYIYIYIFIHILNLPAGTFS